MNRNVDMCCGQIANKAQLIKEYNELEAKAAAFDAIVELCKTNPKLAAFLNIQKVTT